MAYQTAFPSSEPRSLGTLLDDGYGEGESEYRKDIINRSRYLWETSNKLKAVMRAADAFVDVLQDLLEDPDVSEALKRELVEEFDSRNIHMDHKPAENELNLDR